MSIFSFYTNWSEPVSYLLVLIFLFIIRKKRAFIDTYWLVASFHFIGFMLLLRIAYLTEHFSNNIIYYHLLELASLIFLSLFYYKIFKQKGHKVFLIILSVIIFILNILLIGSIDNFNSYSSLTLGGFVVICTYIYFKEKFTHISATPIFHEFNFWFVCKFLIYYVGNFFIFLSLQYFTSKTLVIKKYDANVIVTQLWGVHNLILLFSSLLLYIALWKNLRKKLT